MTADDFKWHIKSANYIRPPVPHAHAIIIVFENRYLDGSEVLIEYSCEIDSRGCGNIFLYFIACDRLVAKPAV